MEPNKQEDLANKLLDAALQHYGETEPRAGLESQVLASLTVERERIASSAFNWWLVPAGAAVLVIVASVVFVSRRTERVTPSIVFGSDQLSVVRPSPISPGPAPLTNLGTLESAQSPPVSRKIHSRNLETRRPMLEQYPSSRPLSQEEELLRAFVTEAPKEQLVMAAAMTKAENLRIESLEIPSLEGDTPASTMNEKNH